MKASTVPRPDQVAFLLLVVSLPVMRPLALSFAGMTVTATDLLFPIAAVLAARAWWRGQLVAHLGPFALLLLLYLATLALSVAQAEDPLRALAKLLANLYLVALGWLTFAHCADAAVRRLAAIAWSAAASATALAMLLGAGLFFAGIEDPEVNFVLWDLGSLPAGNYPRLVGLFLNANMACSYLTVGLCLTAALVLRGGRLRPWGALLLVALLTATLGTLSPGLGGTALAAGLFLWLLFRLHGRPRLAWLALAGAGLAAASMLVATAAYPDLEAWRDGAGLAFAPGPRWLIWRSALEGILERPLFGAGLGAAVADVVYTTPSGVVQHHDDAHNVWLSLGGQAGLLGVAAFAALCGYLLCGLRKPSLAVGEAVALRSCLGLALLAVLFHSLSISLEETRHVWLLFGLLAAAVEAERRSPNGPSTPACASP